MGTLMYVVEGPKHGFTSIPVGIYWAIVDHDHRRLRRHRAARPTSAASSPRCMMLLGWGMLAVPTGIVSAEFTFNRVRGWQSAAAERRCPACASSDHQTQARYCKDCGAALS